MTLILTLILLGTKVLILTLIVTIRSLGLKGWGRVGDISIIDIIAIFSHTNLSRHKIEQRYIAANDIYCNYCHTFSDYRHTLLHVYLTTCCL